jgi:hypothetical protein
LTLPLPLVDTPKAFANSRSPPRSRSTLREHDAVAWRIAILTLLLVAEDGDDTMLPRIGVMRALYSGETAPAPPKKRAGKYRIVR